MDVVETDSDNKIFNSLTNFKAVSTFNESLIQVLEETGFNILPNWSTNDLSALLANIMRFQCNKNGVSLFAKSFTNTSEEEIVMAVDELRNLNKKAVERQYCLNLIDNYTNLINTNSNNCQPNEEELGKVKFLDWSSCAMFATKSRKIPDDSAVLLSKVLTEINFHKNFENVPISESDFVRCNNLYGAAIYSRIYQALSLLISSRAVNKTKSLDAAILLQIFDEMEQDAEKFYKHIEFFKNVFNEIKYFDASEFKIEYPLTEETVAELTTNILNLPKELLNLSNYVD